MTQPDDKDKPGSPADEPSADAGTTNTTEPMDEPVFEPAPATGDQGYSTPDDHMDDHGSGSSIAGMALRFLIIVLVVFGLSLWLVPMIAPHLPASIAKHIMPGQKELDRRLAELNEDVRGRADAAAAGVTRMEKQIADLTQRLAEAETAAGKAREEAAAAREEAAKSARAASTATVAEDVVTKAETAAKAAADAADTATTAATEAGKVAAAATRDAASLARRMTAFEARVASLSDEFKAMSEALANAPTGEGGAPSPELAAAFAALQTRVEGLAKRMTEDTTFLTAEDAERFATQDDLRSARTALQAELKSGLEKLPEPGEIATTTDLAGLRKTVETTIGEIDGRVKAAEENARTAAAAAEAASAESTRATGKVDTAIRSASVRAAVASLTSRLQNGVSFASALGELEKLTGTEAPAALKDAADTGVATTEELRQSFGRRAQAAISADIRAEAANDGILGRAQARLESVVAGRPKNEVEGEGTQSIISRIEARLKEGALPEALSEAEALPEAAKAALEQWLARLEARVAADAAASSYIEELTQKQG